MSELVMLIPAFLGMAGVGAVLQWWQEAHTRWLARLSARGVIASQVEPRTAMASPLRNLRWSFRQRLAPSDVLKIRRLRDQHDDDRVTEAWRLCARRRFRIWLGVGLAWLIGTTVAPAAYALGGWLGLVLTAVVVGGAYLWRGRDLYERLRMYGECEES